MFDAREQAFDINKDLNRMNQLLPRFEGEIPQGSFVIVGYTASVYKKGEQVNLSCNIQWAVLLGTPEGF